ncbi:MAG: dihydrodipicolinate synthase family protein [Acidobacteria bacterium]|nr:dihydrodipicolinate synthase family protein [Acidobacteriota bacterium]
MQSRRFFLQTLSAVALPSSGLFSKEAKHLAGVFPIVQTPFTDDNKLDTRTLAEEIRFLDRTGVQGVVWPQLASEYYTLTMEERFAGMEVVAGAGKPLRPAVVLGVQAEDTETALKYVKHAEKLGPDALIALPPRSWKENAKIFEYYKAIGESAGRPLFAQTIGDMSVDFVLKMISEIPNLQFVKDEAGQTLPRISEFRRRANPRVRGIFTGGHGKTMIDELARGSAGTMPASPFADLYVRVWDAWQAGKREQALDHFSKVMLLVTEVSAYGTPGVKYLLQLRGVFKNTICRADRASALDEEGKQLLKQTLDFVRPLLKA